MVVVNAVNKNREMMGSEEEWNNSVEMTCVKNRRQTRIFMTHL